MVFGSNVLFQLNVVRFFSDNRFSIDIVRFSDDSSENAAHFAQTKEQSAKQRKNAEKVKDNLILYTICAINSFWGSSGVATMNLSLFLSKNMPICIVLTI